MNENIEEILSDIVRIFPVKSYDMQDGIPSVVKLATLSRASLRNGESFDAYLYRNPYLTISATEYPAPSTEGPVFVEMEENPTVKIVEQRGVSGLIYKGNIDISVVCPRAAAVSILNEWENLGSALDYVLMTSDGRLFMMRSLPGTSIFAREENLKKEMTFSLKIEMKMKSPLIPII